MRLEFDYRQFDFHSSEKGYAFKSEKGLSEELVRTISAQKHEPEWMLAMRLEALDHFNKRAMPTWGADLSGIDFDDLHYYVNPTDVHNAKTWDMVPDEYKKTFEKLGIPEAEQKFLAGVGAQFESENIYHSLRADLEAKGVIFSDVETAVQTHPELVRKYFGKIIPYRDNKFSALNTAVWSGGSFVYVPKGVRVDLPLQAYFRINASNVGQFERTLIIAEEGSSVHYVEGCSAPVYSAASLHSAVVEIVALPGSKVQYTTIQNWSNNVYNLVTKRAFAYANSDVFWLDCNIGSRVTMKYPSIYLMGEGARAEILSLAYAGKGQQQDSGGKVIHLAPRTTSVITSKSVSKDGGRTSYRGLLKVAKGCTGVKSSVRCDALLLDEISRSDTYPYMEVEEEQVSVGHEATVGKIGEEQLYYLMSRGLTESEALALIVLGFIEDFSKRLPMEYAIELNRLVELDMSGSVG
jgi:Fe-S cluster assembly protein SufB